MDTRRVFKTPTKNSYASDYIKNKKSKVIFSGTSNLASTIVEQGGAFPLVTPSGHLKPYQGTFGFSSSTQTSGEMPSTYCLNTARSYSDLLNITKGKYLLTPPNVTTMTITQLNDINFSTQLFCGNLYEKGKTGVNESIIFNSSITGVTGATGAANKIIYNTSTTANQWIKVDPSFNMLHNGSSCESEKSNVLTDVMIRRNIHAQRKLDRYLNLDVQGFKFPVKFSLNYEPEDCMNSNNDIQPVVNELSFTSSFLTRTIADGSFLIPSFVTFNSTVPVIYSSSNPAVATISGNTVTIVGIAGITTITASQAASSDGIYPSGLATVQLVVTLVTPTLSAFAIASRDFGSVPFTLNLPTSNSSGAFSFASSDPAVASIVGNVVTVVGAGTTAITATQAAAANYTSKTVTALFVVNPIVPTLSAFAIDSRDFGSVPFTLNLPTSNSLGTFSYASSDLVVASIVGNVVTVVGAGTTTITATQAATTNYKSRTITASFVVNPIAPTLSAFAVASRDFGSQPFSILPNTHAVLYVHNGGSGWQTRIINNDTSNTYLQAWAGIDKQWYDLNYGGWNEVALQFRFFAAYVTKFYNITSASCAVVSAYGNIGSYSFTFNGGTSYTGTFNGQVQSWDYTLPSDVEVNRNSLQPTSNSSGAFSYASSDPTVASIVGNVVTIVKVGTTTITATQAATTNYTSKTITASFVVNPIAPVLTAFTVASKDFGSVPFTLNTPTSNSSGAFSYASSDTAVASIVGNVVTIVGAGTTTITATQAATTNYTSKTITASFVVNPIAPTLSAFAVASKDFGIAPFTLNPPTSNSLGAFSYASGNTGVATISGNIVTIVGAGTTTITATQLATTNYTLKSITVPFIVNPIAPIFDAFTIASRSFGTQPFSILQNTHTVLYVRTGGSDWQTRIINNDTSNANLTWWNPDMQWYRLDVAPQNEIALQFRFFAAYVTTFYNITAVSCRVVSSSGNIGTYSFTFNGGANYTGIFNGQIQQWDYTLPVAVNRNSLQPISNSPGVFTYESSNTGVATISGNTVTIVSAGSSTITARQAATTNYTAGSITAPFVVN